MSNLGSNPCYVEVKCEYATHGYSINRDTFSIGEYYLTPNDLVHMLVLRFNTSGKQSCNDGDERFISCPECLLVQGKHATDCKVGEYMCALIAIETLK